jgi:phage FluMu gp28-like protein
MLSPREEAAALLAFKEELDYEYAKNPWKFFCQQVVTKDESAAITEENVDRRYRWPKDFEYLKEVLTVLQNEPLVAIPKSRRMMVSWLLSAFFIWDARYHANGALFYMSETEQKAAFAVDKRCLFIEENLVDPAFRKNVNTSRTKTGLVGHITYPNESYIWALASGGDVLRQYTATRIFIDESEFQDEAPGTVRAALPMVENGAQLIMASSSGGPVGVMAELADTAGIKSWKDVKRLVA